jgi:hypothetical protein
MNDGPNQDADPSPASQWCELKLLVPPHLYRSWQRCSWLLVHETGRSRLAVMQEMVEDFLHKHGC